MKVRHRYIPFSIALLLLGMVAFSGKASESQEPEEEKSDIQHVPHVFDFLKRSNTWLHSSNPAGMTFAEMHNMGTFHFQHDYKDGGFRRPQEAAIINQFGFATERFQRLNEMRFRGNFSFHTVAEHNRNWGVLMDPFYGSPYIFTDERGGDWSKQFYHLGAGMSTGKLFDLFFAGVDIDYNVKTGARQADPRPLTNTYRMVVRPGVIFPVTQNMNLGVSGFYSNRNEEVSITVTNFDFQHRWFKMRGVGEYRTGFMTGFFRAYNGSTAGGGLQLEYDISGMQFIAEANYHLFNEEVTDGSSVLQHGGQFDESSINGFLSLRMGRENCIHLARAFFDIREGRGTEHSQNYDVNVERWVTFATTLRYLGDRYSAGVGYDYFRTNETQSDYSWMGGFLANIEHADLRFLVPSSSQMHTFAQIGAHGRLNLPMGNNTLHVAANAGYRLPLDDELRIHRELIDDGRTVIAYNVAMPDHEYMISEHLSAGLELTYNFSIFQSAANNFFMGLKADRYFLTNNSSDHFTGNNRSMVMVRLGVVY